MVRALGVLFNRSWQTGETPLAWREANICPLPKEDYPSRASEFRPIILVPFCFLKGNIRLCLLFISRVVFLWLKIHFSI